MRRIISIVGLFLLIVFVILCYFILVEPERSVWFIYNSDTLIPAGALEKPNNVNKVFFKPAYLILLGVLVVGYLKIIWKLISFNWKFNFKKAKVKRKVRGY